MNTSEAKLLNIRKTLENCLRELPDQFALVEVKTNLRKTVESINNVQSKRKKRKIQELQNENTKKMGFLSIDDAKRALEILDSMMKDEQKVIDSANSQNNQDGGQDFTGGMLLG
jgi:hypothetical protein